MITYFFTFKLYRGDLTAIIASFSYGVITANYFLLTTFKANSWPTRQSIAVYRESFWCWRWIPICPMPNL